MIHKKLFQNVWISGVGTYIPFSCITVKEIAQAHNADANHISSSLGITKKTVALSDEDSITMAVAATLKALGRSGVQTREIGAIYMGSESHPYAVKPSGTVIGEWLGIEPDYLCADLQFACKAGTAGIQIVSSFIECGLIENGIAIGSDKAQSKPGDALEYAAASCAVSVVLSQKSGLAKLKAYSSYSTDTPDFWRRQTEDFPKHGGRFTGEPAYFLHIEQAIDHFLKLYSKKITDFEHVVLHMPNGKFPLKVAKDLKISKEQLQLGFTVTDIGNPYSASSMFGAARVLGSAKKGDQILLVSYGSGSGSDVIWFEMERHGDKVLALDIDRQLGSLQERSYLEYLRHMKLFE